MTTLIPFLEATSFSSKPPFRRYFLNVLQIAWLRGVDEDDRVRDFNGLYKRDGTLICMSDGTKIIVDDDVKNVIRSMVMVTEKDTYCFDEGNKAQMPPIEFVQNEPKEDGERKQE